MALRSIPIPDIRAALVDRMPDLCQALLGGGKRVCGEWICGSTQGDKGRSLSVRLSGSKAGVWSDFASDQKGGPFELIMACQGLTFGQAVAWALNFLGQDPPPRSAKTPDEQEAKREELALEIWANSQATGHEGYLRGRGITLLSSALRFANLKHSPEHTGPCMVAAVTDSAGVIRAVHRTWLAPVTPRKKALGRCSGASIRLAPVGPVLGLAEGIETALSAMMLFPGLPVWAGVGTSGIRGVILPAEVREVVIFSDADEPGRKAAQVTRDRLKGRKVEIREAPHGDWNDVLLARLEEQA